MAVILEAGFGKETAQRPVPTQSKTITTKDTTRTLSSELRFKHRIEISSEFNAYSNLTLEEQVGFQVPPSSPREEPADHDVRARWGLDFMAETGIILSSTVKNISLYFRHM